MIVPQFELEWKEPPSPAQAAYEPILRELKARPGKWARVQKGRSTTSGTASWNKLGCEAKAHRINPGEKPPAYDIYVRWPEIKTPPNPVKQAVAAGTAITPRPGGYIANREARGIPADGNPVGALNHHPIT
jgi:hypothetical protein